MESIQPGIHLSERRLYVCPGLISLSAIRWTSKASKHEVASAVLSAPLLHFARHFGRGRNLLLDTSLGGSCGGRLRFRRVQPGSLDSGLYLRVGHSQPRSKTVLGRFPVYWRSRLPGGLSGLYACVHTPGG